MAQTVVTLSGPFFRKDIDTTVKGAIRKVVQRTAEYAQKDYQASLVPGRGFREGRYKKTIRRKSRGFTTTVASRNAPIATWLEGTSKRNRTTRFKGYRLYAQATQRTDRTAGAEARRIVAELVQELGG